MKLTNKLSLSGLFVALGFILSAFSIPLGFAKAFPIQHLINMLSGLLLGPLYSVSTAFLISLLRNLSGTGSLFAFPGSMIGALLAGIVARKMIHSKYRLLSTSLAELFGTGIIGALLCYPISLLILKSQMAVFGLVIPFVVSSLVGNVLGFLFASLLLPILVKSSKPYDL